MGAQAEDRAELADLAARFDHTLLRPGARPHEIDRLCDEARAFGFAAVCVNPVHVARCRRRLEGSRVKTATVIGFPLGETLPDVKACEARRAQDEGAEELDMVLRLGALRSGEDEIVREDIAAVVGARRPGVLVKVILETCLLDEAAKRRGCRLAEAAGADFVKTSTGFAGGGATVEDVAILREEVGGRLGIKAAGGIRDLATVRRLIAAGATRIGASASVAILEELRR